MKSPFTDFIEVNSEDIISPVTELKLNGPFTYYEQAYTMESVREEETLEEAYPVIEGELSGPQLQKAVDLNEKYKKLYKWENYVLMILSQIVANPAQYPAILFDPKKFAQAFAAWQRRNGIKTTLPGVLGINNWTYIQKKIGYHNLSNKHSINAEKAVVANKKYESAIWAGRKDEIYSWFVADGITFFALPISDEFFAYAVADFQALKKLSVDGILGPGTWEVMKKRVIPAPAPAQVPTSLTPSKWRRLIPDAVQSPVETFVNGNEAFKEIARVIKTAKGKSHFIYLLSGWVVDVNFCLSPNEDKSLAGNDTSSTFKSLLKQANADVEIKILSWNNPKTLNELRKAEKFIDELRASGRNATMFRDNFTYGTEFMKNLMNKVRYAIKAVSLAQPALNFFDFWNEVKEKAAAFPNQGSHHEKILIVNGSEGLIAFCGGMDINADRVIGLKSSCCDYNFTDKPDCDLEEASDKKMRSRILHDVHCKLGGRAAEILLQRFIDRWNLHLSQHAHFIPKMADFVPIYKAPASPDTPYVKVLHTFNHPVKISATDRSILKTVEHVIKNATKTIVIEDQYMISPEIARWLNEAAKENKYLEVHLYTQDDEFAGGDMWFPHYFRRRFREILYKGLTPDEIKKRIKIFILDPLSAPPNRRKVHSKTYIIDEELAIIGSANCNRRSMTFDSETSVLLFQDGEPSQSIVKILNDKIRGDRYNRWIEYKENHSKEAQDMDVRIRSSKYFIVPVIAIGGIGGTLLALKALNELSGALRDIIDPHPDGEPDIIKEVETELDDFIYEHDEGFNEESEERLLLANDNENAPPYEREDISTYSFESNDQLSTIPCSCHGKTNEHVKSETQNVGAIEGETTQVIATCEGRTCWAKTVLNKLLGFNLPLNNTLDEPTKQAIVDFQVKNNLPQTRTIDTVTERALLEADSIQKKGASAANIITEAKTRIEDWTNKGVSGVKNKPQHILNSFRDPRKLWAFVLHHMAFKRRGGPKKQFSAPESYVNTGAHFCIMLDGRIIQLHPVSRMIWHGNCVSPRSVAVEFEGNFPSVKGKWWYPTDKKTGIKIKINEDTPTQVQYDSGRFLASYLKIVLGTTHILAHRQSSSSRENDPGPDIWYNVGQWAINNLGMTHGGPSYKCGSGNPILPEWRTWGNKPIPLINKEYAETENGMDWEEIENESIEFDPDKEEPGEDQFYNEPEEEDITEQFNSSYEVDGLVNDWSKAVRLNRYFSDQIGWKQFYDQINDLVLPLSGQQNVSLSEEALAEAVAKWQQQQGLTSDGVIGPGTWQVMKPFIKPANAITQPAKQTTGSIPGTFGNLKINTSIPALSKSLPEYQFTSEDALWLARFVEGEAGGQDNPDSHAVIWAMFNRFGTVRHRVPSWTSFAVFLQKYSTTLQPLLNSAGAAERVWANNRKSHDKYPVKSSDDTYPGTKIKKVQYVKHIKLQQKKWNDFPTYVQNMISGILNGKISNPGIGIATHFLSTYVLLKASRRKQGISGEPSKDEWRQYTLRLAGIKKTIWIGDKNNLNQQKNAFFIQPEFKNVPADAIIVEATSSEFESPDYGFMNEIEYHEAIEDVYKQSESQPLEFEKKTEENHYHEDAYQVENFTEPDTHNNFYELEDLVTDISKVVSLNRSYSEKLGWKQSYGQINTLLLPYSGLQDVSLSEEDFAHALAAWQQHQGFSLNDADGILGPNTWRRMQPLLNTIPAIPLPSPATTISRPSTMNIFEFNKWHAQRILDKMNAGILGSNFNSRVQLEKILRGEQVFRIDSTQMIIKTLPIIDHIGEEAANENYNKIIIGSFIRDAANGKCTGHCAGRCIDINYKDGNFNTSGSLEMVIKILNYLVSLPQQFKRSLGFGMPLQGNFFGNQVLTKFKSASPSYLLNAELRKLVPQLGIVFPDNNNHLHIQVNWELLETETEYMGEEAWLQDNEELERHGHDEMVW